MLAVEDEALELRMNYLMSEFHAHALVGVLRKVTVGRTETLLVLC